MNLSVRRPSRRRLGVAVVVLLLAGMLASLVGASAAQLNLGPVARQHAEVKQRCDLDGVALTTPSTSTTTTRVDVGGIAAACVGLPIVVRVSTGAGASSSTTATNVIAGGSMSITTASPAFSPAAVVQTSVTIGDWPMSGTWSYTPPAPLPAVSCRIPSDPSLSCTAVISGTTQWPTPVTHWQRYVTVSTTSPAPVVWEATINLSSPVFPVFAKRLEDLQGGLILVGTSSCSANPRTVTVRGTTSWGDYHQIHNGKSSQFQVEGSSSGSGDLLTCP